MSSTVAWNLRLTVRDGRVDDARALMEEMVTATRQEPGALGYEWFLSTDGSTCHTRERYLDSDAVLTHLGSFGTHFAERFMQCFAPTDLTVYGNPSDQARAALDGFGAAYLRPWGGFVR